VKPEEHNQERENRKEGREGENGGERGRRKRIIIIGKREEGGRGERDKTRELGKKRLG
jgi:hypothetical protein